MRLGLEFSPPNPIFMKSIDLLNIIFLLLILFPLSGCSNDGSLKKQPISTLEIKSTDTMLSNDNVDTLIESSDNSSQKIISQYSETDSLNVQEALLSNYLIKYREIESKAGFVKIPAVKRIFSIGDTAFSIKLIKQFLFQTQDINIIDTTFVFDSVLLAGVQSFQSRMGYQPNGKISKTIIDEMNVPVTSRINQIVSNIEKFKVFNPKRFTNYLLVNIPEFKLHLIEDNQLLWSMKIIVGKTSHPTAEFENQIQFVVFSPYWNVPRSILINELMPLINRNKKYLAMNHMEWVGDNIRQRPGPDNPLGLVKFLFPNRYNMYLHDTPAKSLFNQDKRTFSHGCIRIAEAKKLAEYLLKNEVEWSKIKIEDAMHAKVERFVKLKKPLPIFIAYFTSWVDEKGKLQFRKDIYKKEKKVKTLQ